MGKNIFIHETSIVDDGAIVGDYTSIWHFSHVENLAKIGENCNLGQNTYVGKNSIIGNACRLGNSVSIFSNVELEDFVFCGPFMVFTHIAFPRAAISRQNVFEKTIVRKGVSLGANSTIIPGVDIGQGAFIGAGAVLTKSCKPWSLMVGVPAKQVGWVSAFGEKIPLPLHGEGVWICPHTADRYILIESSLERIAGDDDILKYMPGNRMIRRMLNPN